MILSTRRTTIGACAALLLAACYNDSAPAVPFYRSAALTPEWLSNRVTQQSDFHHVARFALRDQHDTTVTERALAGRVTVIHFFFTQCGGVCPTTQTNLARLLASMPSEARVQVLSHSVTPERDSVPVLAMYAAMHDIRDPRWHLLTGARHDIDSLATTSYFVTLRDGRAYDVNNLAHTETLVLVDGRGRLRGVYTGTLRLDVERLGEDIRALLREAA